MEHTEARAQERGKAHLTEPVAVQRIRHAQMRADGIEHVVVGITVARDVQLLERTLQELDQDGLRLVREGRQVLELTDGGPRAEDADVGDQVLLERELRNPLHRDRDVAKVVPMIRNAPQLLVEALDEPLARLIHDDNRDVALAGVDENGKPVTKYDGINHLLTFCLTRTENPAEIPKDTSMSV